MVTKSAASARSMTTVPNFRDLATAFDQIVPGRVLRCAKPSDASAEDVDLLLHVLGIRELLDLRSETELREDDPASLLFARSGFQRYSRNWWTGQVRAVGTAEGPTKDDPVRHNVSLLERARYFTGLFWHIPIHAMASALALGIISKERSRKALLKEINAGGLPLLYKILLDTSKPEFCTVLRLISEALEAGRPVLFFCKAGKDRTGLVAALVLAACGCPEPLIVEDYAMSDSYHRMALAGIENNPELRGLNRAVFEAAPRQAITEALQYLHCQYGGPHMYMQKIGFLEQQQQRLKELLTTADLAVATAQNKL
eukprot:CAMPEP_0202890628 /NCGR_PEP_ID=MMETSP1392-20130828/968_1 /ASSEMBLY_ACC=CAM_ASM_000868 /TAXON_ID=225041 /ORGANISM="Chlamydomonas chlamydogama, Strain SAG 11-48b" /LENGTH=312 /DNA_ID=CAMNT_0049574231 /DNA_START=219 /DNA_END=1157 /DNA_ORIENTATION=-